MSFFTGRHLYTSPKTESQLRETLTRINQLIRLDGEKLDALDEAITSLSVSNRQSAEADSDMTAGQAVRIPSEDHIDLAQADVVANADVIGIVVSDVASGGEVDFAYGGIVQVDDWGLTPGADYFLSATTAGKIVTSPDGSAAGNMVRRVGRAISAEEFLVDVSISVKL